MSHPPRKSASAAWRLRRVRAILRELPNVYPTFTINDRVWVPKETHAFLVTEVEKIRKAIQ